MHLMIPMMYLRLYRYFILIVMKLLSIVLHIHYTLATSTILQYVIDHWWPWFPFMHITVSSFHNHVICCMVTAWVHDNVWTHHIIAFYDLHDVPTFIVPSFHIDFVEVYYSQFLIIIFSRPPHQYSSMLLTIDHPGLL